ncbi:KH domain protein, partial [Ancylostoma caninum]
LEGIKTASPQFHRYHWAESVGCGDRGGFRCIWALERVSGRTTMYPLLPAPPSMYSSLSESTVLSSAEPKTEPVCTFFEASKEFLQFLSARSGMHEILLYEDTLGVEIKLEANGFRITHPPEIPVKPIEMGLKKLFYDVEFTKCLRLSALRLRCPGSQELFLTPPQYALLHETKLAVTRNAGLADILVSIFSECFRNYSSENLVVIIKMDHDGRACMFGTHDSIVGGRVAVRRMFNENGLGPFEFRPSATPPVDVDSNNNKLSTVDNQTTPFDHKTADGWTTDMSRPPPPLPDAVDTNNLENTNSQSSSMGRGQTTDQSGSSNSFGNGSQLTSSELASSNTEPPPVVIAEQRKSIRFFVSMSDAPRLIGSRGANKRRIEQLTGCNVLLHTEKKEHGEFPVEVFASSSKRCELARQHILSFLASGHTTVDEASASMSGTKNKDVRVRPKVHLDISPKKLQKKHAD